MTGIALNIGNQRTQAKGTPPRDFPNSGGVGTGSCSPHNRQGMEERIWRGKWHESPQEGVLSKHFYFSGLFSSACLFHKQAKRSVITGISGALRHSPVPLPEEGPGVFCFGSVERRGRLRHEPEIFPRTGRPGRMRPRAHVVSAGCACYTLDSIIGFLTLISSLVLHC